MKGPPLLFPGRRKERPEFPEKERERIMKIAVAGLGLIGGSAALALARAGMACDGYDRPEVTARALEKGVIAHAAEDFSVYDVVLVALPPDPAIEFLDTVRFGDGAVVADFCGVKQAVEKAVYARERAFRYVGCHPMAGKEVSGLENAEASLFDGASMLMTIHEKTDPEAAAFLEDLYLEMGFGGVVRCTAAYHDSKIAYTSQLAHIVSNAYVKSSTAHGFPGYTGGSFQDMTRIAGVDEDIWTRLYMLNLPAIRQELSVLIGNMQSYLTMLEAEDEEGLKVLLREGRVAKEKLDTERKII